MIIDLHSHLIPGVDDGTQTLEDSLKLAKLAVDEGIKHIVLTPHHRNGQFNNYAETIVKQMEELQQAYDNAGIPLTVYPGQEIRLTEYFMDDLFDQKLLSLDGGGKYYLIELPTKRVPSFTKEYLQMMIDQGITPIIAHPERNAEIMKDYSILEEFIEMGCIGQLTAVSYSGMIGEEFLNVARDFIKLNLVQIMSSDVHHIDWRPFNMKSGYDRMEQEFGIGKVQEFKDNARSIINGDDIIVTKIQTKKVKNNPKKKKRFFGLF